jgi:hypothetical protein
MDYDLIPELLEARSDAQVAKGLGKAIRPLRGIRGVANGEIAKVTAESWRALKPKLPDDADALSTLFGNAYEDGLVAIGLLAAILPSQPADALELTLEWLDRTDDLLTADAIGWFLLGPAVLAKSATIQSLISSGKQARREEFRRAVSIAGLAFLPIAAEGPTAAALREKLGTKEVHFCEGTMKGHLTALLNGLIRDDGTMVRKGVRRVLKAWLEVDPPAAIAWANGVNGGIHRMYKDEVEEAERKLAAREKRAAREARKSAAASAE